MEGLLINEQECVREITHDLYDTESPFSSIHLPSAINDLLL